MVKKIIHGLYRNTFARWTLRRKIRSAQNLKLVIGAADSSFEDWISTQEYQMNLLQPQTWKSYLGDRKIDHIVAEHVWEHLSLLDGQKAAKTCYDFLNQGGRLRVAVPDGFFPEPEYIDYVKPGGHGIGSDDHKVLFNYKSFQNIFEAVGFKTQLLEYFDESGVFHSQNWELKDGFIARSLKYDERNQNGQIKYTSIILDAIKSKEI